MWFEDNIIYCSDGTQTTQFDISKYVVVPYDPTKDTALLPYESDQSSIAYKDQTICNALYEQLGQIIQNEKDNPYSISYKQPYLRRDSMTQL